jgi:hypothetical protein
MRDETKDGRWIMGLIAWWLVISRLETSGPEEFFATVQRDAEPPVAAAD